MDTKKLRQKILDLAIRGKLVPQDPNDEPASVLIEKIRAEKEQLIKEKKIKRDKNESYIYRSDKSYYEQFPDGTVKCIDEEIPFEIPESWEWANVCSITNYIQRGKSPKYSPIEKYPVLAQKCNQWDGISLEKALFVDPETITKYSEERFLINGDIIINSTGTGTLGRVGLYKDIILGKYDCIVADSHITVVRSNVNIFHSYLYYFFRSAYQQKKLIDNAAGSTNQKELYVDTIKSFYCPIPPQEEQQRIVEEVERCYKVVDVIEGNKEDLKQFITQTKSKILDLAIRGKLVPQDPNDEPASVLLERIKSEHTDSKKKTKNTGDNSHYTDTFDIPNNWVVTTMQEICYLSDGEKIEGKALPYLDVKYLRGKSEPKIVSSGRFVERNNFMILVDGENSGEIFSVTEDGYQGSTFKILNISKQVNEAFIFKLLQNEQTTFKESKVGSAIPHLNKKLFRELYVFLPPLAEQKRIVLKIEEIFASLDEIANSIIA